MLNDKIVHSGVWTVRLKLITKHQGIGLLDGPPGFFL